MSSRRRLTIPATPSSPSTPRTPMASNRGRSGVPSAVGVILSSPNTQRDAGVDEQKRRAAERQEQLERWRAQRQQMKKSSTATNATTTATTGTFSSPSPQTMTRPSPRSSTTTTTRHPNESQMIESSATANGDTVTAASPIRSKRQKDDNQEHVTNGDAETEQIHALSRQVESMVADMEVLSMVRDSKRGTAHPPLNDNDETPSPPKIVTPKFTTNIATRTTTLRNGRTGNSSTKRRPITTSIRTDLDHTTVSAVPLSLSSSSPPNHDKDVDYNNPLAEYLHQQSGNQDAATEAGTTMEDDNRSKTSRTTLHTLASESHMGGSVKRPFESHSHVDTAVQPNNRHRPGRMPVVSIQVETTTSTNAARPPPPPQQQQQQQQHAKRQTTQDAFRSPKLGSLDHPTQQQQQQRIFPSYDPHRPVVSPKDPEMTFFNSSTPTPTPPTLTPSRFDQIPIPPPDLQDTGGNSSHSPRYPSHRPNHNNATVLPPHTSNRIMPGGGVSSPPKKESPYYNNVHTNGFARPATAAAAAAGVSSSVSVTSLTTHRGSVHRGVGGAGSGSGPSAATVGGEYRESIRNMMHGISDQLVSIHRAAHAREGYDNVVDEDATSYNTRALGWRQQHPAEHHSHHHPSHQQQQQQQQQPRHHHQDNTMSSDTERQLRQTTARLEETLALIEGKADAMVQVLELNDARTAALERENEQLRGRMHQILVQLSANPTKEAFLAATGRLLELNQPPPAYPVDDSRSIVSLPLPPPPPSGDSQQQQQHALIPSPPRRMQQQQQQPHQQHHPSRDEWLLGSSDRVRGPTGHDLHSNSLYRGEAVGGGGGYSDFNLAPTFSYESSAHNYPRRTSPPDPHGDDGRYYDPRHNQHHHHNSTSSDRFTSGEAAAAAAAYSSTTHNNMAHQHQQRSTTTTNYPDVNQTAGTMFVTELSELMELDSGDHARLANILDDRWTGHVGGSGNPNHATTPQGTTPTGTAGRPTTGMDYALPPTPNGSYPRRTPTSSSRPPPPPQSHPQQSPPHPPPQQPSQPRNQQQYNPYNPRNY